MAKQPNKKSELAIAREVLRHKGVDDSVPLADAIVEACRNHAEVYQRRLGLAVNYVEQLLRKLPEQDPTRVSIATALPRYVTTPTAGEYATAVVDRKRQRPTGERADEAQPRET